MSWSHRPPLGDLLPGARHFYAKIRKFSLACPNCGRVTNGGPGEGWHPTVSHWTCPGCGRRYHLGIVAWPSARGKMRQFLPTDTLPTRDQAVELANLIENQRRGEEGVNVVVEREPNESEEE
jgi:hypothetical protein